MTKRDPDFLEQVTKFIEVITAQATTVQYITTQIEPQRRRKAGMRTKGYLFPCLNCREIAQKRSKAKYCSDRCRKEAERKREAAARFYRKNKNAIITFLQENGDELVQNCDKIA